MKFVLTGQECRGILSKLSSRIVEKQPGTTNSWKFEIIKKSKNFKKLLTIQKTDDIISELRLRKT